jgi:hypothetical protein
MKRREFLAGIAAATASTSFAKSLFAQHEHEHASCGLTYESPRAAMRAPRETLAYMVCLYAGTGIEKKEGRSPLGDHFALQQLG